MAESTVSSLCEEAREHLHNLRVDEGEAAARQALELDPNSDDALTLLGIALCRKGRITDGIETLGQAVALNPNNVTARSNLATARHQAGHLEAAQAEWLMVLGLDPDNAKARSALAVVEWQLQQAAGQSSGPGEPASPFPQPNMRQTAAQSPMPEAEALRHDLAGNPIAAPTPPQPQPAHGESLGSSSATIIHYPQAAPIPGPPSMARSVGASHKVANSEYDPGGWSLDAIRAILTSPTEFMASQRGHYDLGKPVMFALINGLIVSVPLMLMQLRPILMAPLIGSCETRGSFLAVGAGVVGGIFRMGIGVGVCIVAGIVAQIIMAAIIHLIVMMLGGKEPYGGTFRALVYASVPGYVACILSVGLIMIHPSLALLADVIAVAGAVWSIVVAVIGIGVIHVMSGCAAFGAIFLGGVALVGIMLILSLALVGVMQALLAESASSRPDMTLRIGAP